MKMQGNYKKCWKYLKDNRNYFLIIIVSFVVSGLIGFFFPVFFEEMIQKLIAELVSKTEGMNFYQLAVFIFKNNLLTAFVGMLLGIIFGIFPFVLTVINGYILGFVSGKVSGVLGNSALLRLIPHGIFELPALVISLGLGLRLGMCIFSDNSKKELGESLEESLRVFVFVILPLLVIAAIIEAGLMFLIG